MFSRLGKQGGNAAGIMTGLFVKISDDLNLKYLDAILEVDDKILNLEKKEVMRLLMEKGHLNFEKNMAKVLEMHQSGKPQETVNEILRIFEYEEKLP